MVKVTFGIFNQGVSIGFLLISFLLRCIPVHADTSPNLLQSLQSLTPPNTRFISAIHSLTKDFVPYIRIDGVITVDNPGPSEIRFMIALPAKETFNGRFFFVSQGGTGGQIPDPDPELIRQGFAQASSDRGTSPAFSVDASVYNDPVQAINLGYRATHLTATASQRFVREYYDVKSLYRYTGGCSGGGLAGFNNMRKYGAEDFDGVVIGDTAVVGAANNLWWARFYQYLLNNPEGWLSPELLVTAEKIIINRYDGVDGVVDGIINDERLFSFDTTLLKEAGFNGAQMAMFSFMQTEYRYLLTSPTLKVGSPPVSRLSNWTRWFFGSRPPPWSATNAVGVPLAYKSTRAFFDTLPGQPDLLITDFSDPDVQAWFERPDGSSDAPFDFRKFRDAGGKAILYYGVDDPFVGFHQHGLLAWQGIKSFESDPENVTSWVRLFAVPGLLHCRGGPGPENVLQKALEATIAWVERGIAPEFILTQRESGEDRIFLLCPEPHRAIFKGIKVNPDNIDINNVKNWTCN